MNNSSITQEHGSCIYDESLFEDMKLASLIIFGGLGVAGNMFIILLAAKYTKRKNLHYLIINMAVSDIIIVIMYILRDNRLFMVNSAPEDLANHVCKGISFLENTSESLTLITLLIISVGRCRATKLVMSLQPSSSIKLLCIAWLISMILGSPSLVFSHVIRSDTSSRFSCSQYSEERAFHIIYISRSICLLVLYISVFALSLLTSVNLSKSNAIAANLSDEQRKRREWRIMNAVKMVICSMLLYSLCYLPDFLEDIVKATSRKVMLNVTTDCQVVMKFILHFLKVINSLFSPAVYLVFLADFREAVGKIIKQVQPARYQQQSHETRL